MKRKKLFALITSVALIAVVGIGATLAYFTDNAEASNVVTMGHVDITLTENEVEKNDDGDYVIVGEDVVTEEGLTFDGVLPGDTIPKNPTVTAADDSMDAYIRVKMDITSDGGITEADIAALETGLRSEITNGTGWYYNSADDCYYYNAPLTAGASAVLFETVTIPAKEWTNNTADQSFTIKLTAEAIQADNIDWAAYIEGGYITSWPDAQIEAYTAAAE